MRGARHGVGEGWIEGKDPISEAWDAAAKVLFSCRRVESTRPYYMVGVAKLSGKSNVLHAVIYVPKDYQYVGRGIDMGKRIQENKKGPYRLKITSRTHPSATGRLSRSSGVRRSPSARSYARALLDSPEPWKFKLTRRPFSR